MDKAKDGSLKVTNGDAKAAPKKRGRWDQTVEDSGTTKKKIIAVSNSSAATPIWDGDVSTYIFIKKKL